MTIERLRQAHKAEPFRPFTLSLADGRRGRVPSRENLWIPPRADRTFAVGSGEDDMSIHDSLLVISIDYGRARGDANDHARRR